MAKPHDKMKKMAGRVKHQKEPYFGLPRGEKDTPQLRKRFKNWVKRTPHMTSGPGDKKDNYRLHRMNSFYEFNKPEYDK